MTINRKYHFKKSSGEHWREINDLYFLITKRKRTREQYDWEWINTSLGRGSMWIIEDKEDDKLIGHHGLIPMHFNANGEILLAGKTENTMIHPNYRKKLFYLPYERKFLNEAREDFSILYTTAGKGGPGAIRKRLGYHLVGYWHTYLLHINPKLYKNKKSICSDYNTIHYCKIGKLLLVVLFNGIRGVLRKLFGYVKIKRIHDLSEFINKTHVFWEKNRAFFGITPDRNRVYLEWRIKRNPYIEYMAYELYDNEGTCGFAIAKKVKEIKDSESYTVVYIEDLITRHNNKELYVKCINTLINTFMDFNIVYFRTVYTHNNLNIALGISQFLPLRMHYKKNKTKGTPFYAFFNKGYLKKDWFITELLKEGIN